MSWSPEVRPTASEALQHSCFHGITNIVIPRDVGVYQETWYNYKESKQKNIDWKMRSILFDWLWQLHIELKYNRVIIVVTYALIDRFLKCTIIKKKTFS